MTAQLASRARVRSRSALRAIAHLCLSLDAHALGRDGDVAHEVGDAVAQLGDELPCV